MDNHLHVWITKSDKANLDLESNLNIGRDEQREK